MYKKTVAILLLLAMALSLNACGKEKPNELEIKNSLQQNEQEIDIVYQESTENSEAESAQPEEEQATQPEVEQTAQPESETEDVTEQIEEAPEPEETVIEWDENWQYADYSILHSDSVTLYRATAGERKDIVVTVNAGHGTSGGTSVKTLCHPDGSAKVTGGSTAEGSIKAAGVSSGTTMLDGTPEGNVTLSLALLLKDTLLNNGYDVLMIRESEDIQLDNIARTVFANNNSDCHIAIHYNSTDYDAGFFYIGVPDIESYKAMEPVASHWKEHNAFGAALLEGIREEDVKVCGDGFMGLDLTQTSYSTVPSTDVEVGDRASDYSQEVQQQIADGILAGLNIWFEER